MPAANVVQASPSGLVTPNLTNLDSTAPALQQYSYTFDGCAQTLDHILVNNAMIAATTARQVEHPRINADFPETNRNDANSPSRLSDHDPVVGFFTISGLPVELTSFRIE